MKDIARWVVLGALFVIPFIPLYVANTLYFPFITGKGFIFRILIDIAVVAYAVLAIADKKYRPQFSWVFALYGALALWMLIADIFALNPFKAFWSNYERMDGWVTLIHVFAFFVIAGAVLTADNLWKRWWMTFIGASALIVGYSLIQLAGGAEIHQGGVRVDASIGNAAYLGSYLLFAIGVTVWQALSNKGWLRYSLLVLGALQVVILFATATRGAILGLVGAAVLAALLFAFESGKKGRKGALVVLAGLVLIIAGFFLAKDSAFVTENPTLSRISSITLAEGQTRFTLWGMAAKGVMERPLTGYGHEGFNYLFNTYYTPSLYGQEPWFDRAHNVFVDWLVWGGVPAFLLLIGLIGSAALAIYRSDAPRSERILLISILAAYSFQALFVFDHLFSYVPLAAVLAMAHASSSRPIKKMESLPVAKRSQFETLIAPAGLVIALVLAWMVNVPHMQGANSLVYAISPAQGGPKENLEYFKKAAESGALGSQELAEQLVSFYARLAPEPSVPNSLKADYLDFAVERVEAEIDRAPSDARLRLQYALLLRASGDPEAALRETDEALRLSPYKQQFYLERAEALYSIGRAEEARETLYAAYELDTSFTELAAYAAAGDILTGRTEEGNKLLLSAFGTTTVDHPALLRAYVEKEKYPELIALLLLQKENQKGSVDSRVRLISGYALAGKISEARAEAYALLAAHPSESARVEALLAGLPK